MTSDDEAISHYQQAVQNFEFRVTDLESAAFGNPKTGQLGLVKEIAAMLVHEAEQTAQIAMLKQDARIGEERFKGWAVVVSLIGVASVSTLITVLTQVVNTAGVVAR